MKNCEGKSPAFQFYVKDWLSDPELQKAHPITRGIWINLLCYMWDAPDRGKLETNERELCQLGSCLLEDIKIFLDDAKRLDFCDICVTCHASSQNCHADVTIKNRRMFREYVNNEKARMRKAKQRKREVEQKQEKKKSRSCHADVTPLSPTPTPTPTPINKEKESTCCAKSKDAQTSFFCFFELFWNTFDDKKGKKAALKSWNKIQDLTEKLCNEIIEGAKKYALERKNILAKNGTPKMAQGWLTDRRWEDEISTKKDWKKELKEKHGN